MLSLLVGLAVADGCRITAQPNIIESRSRNIGGEKLNTDSSNLYRENQ